MTTPAVTVSSERRTAAVAHSIDVCGVLWPLHKVQAVAVGVLTLVVGVVLIAAVGGSSFAPAVLVATAAAIATWWTARALHARP